MSAANESVDSVCRSGCAFQPDARSLFYVDGLICYHSCCQVLQLNLTARASHQAIKKNSGRLGMLLPLGSVSALLPPFWGSVSTANGSVDSVCRSGCAFQPDARKPLYVDGLICYHSCCQVLQLNLTARAVPNSSTIRKLLALFMSE